MAIAIDKVVDQFFGVVTGTPINCNWPLYAENEVIVIYGFHALVATLNVDYTVQLDAPDYDLFTVTPLAALLTKINDLIAADTEGVEVNYVTIRRKLDYLTSVQVESVRNTSFIKRELERTAMRFQQMEEQSARVLTLSAKSVGGATGIELGTPIANRVLAWDATAAQIISGPDVSVVEDASLAAADAEASAVAASNSAAAAAATAAAITGAGYATLASPLFTGDPRGPTPVISDNDTSLVTSAFVRRALSVYNAKAYGAIGDGVTNDRAAIQSAITACGAAGGGIVYIPHGSYYVPTPLVLLYNNVQIMGEGRGATRLFGVIGQDMFHLGGTAAVSGVFHSVVSDMAIDTCRRTIWIDHGTNDTVLRNLLLSNAVDPIVINGDLTLATMRPSILTYLYGIDISNFTGSGIVATQTAELHWDELQIGSATGFAGILLDSATNAVYAGRANLLSCQYGLLIRDTAGVAPNPHGIITKPSQMWFSQLLGDTCNVNGIYVQDGFQLKFQQCWGSGAQTDAGIRLGAGALETEFSDAWAINNSRDGVRVVSGASRIRFNGGCFISNSATAANNYDGIAIEAGATHVAVHGVHMYNSVAMGYGNTQRYAANLLAGASDYVIIQGCDTSGNVSGGIVNASTGANISIANNL